MSLIGKELLGPRAGETIQLETADRGFLRPLGEVFKRAVLEYPSKGNLDPVHQLSPNDVALRVKLMMLSDLIDRRMAKEADLASK